MSLFLRDCLGVSQMSCLSERQLAVIITSCESGGNRDLKQRAENVIWGRRQRRRMMRFKQQAWMLLGMLASIRII